nr:tRNA lysidine(34) synthetase TilS [Aliiroseovarius sp. F20344]
MAVSGGSDSIAMLGIAHDWAKSRSVDLLVATVDHGLRAEARQEADWVATQCDALGLPHETLRWEDAPRGNVQGAARAARYELLSEWAQRNTLDAVALAHTTDDQAETFIMRLARGSGVDGLAAMRYDWHAQGVRWLRPVLGCKREDLRAELTSRGMTWVDDPSNDDTRFDRVRVRQAMDDLATLGLDQNRLVSTAQRMSDAREALAYSAHQAAEALVKVQLGDVEFPVEAYALLPTETRHRLLAAAIGFVSGATYRPRYDALKEVEQQALSRQRRTLSGCVLSLKAGQLVVGREFQAVRSKSALPGEVWDGRWVLSGPDGTQVRALGEAISNCDDWRATGHSRDRLMTTPALFDKETLLAAPIAGFVRTGTTLSGPDKADFLKAILSH